MKNKSLIIILVALIALIAPFGMKKCEAAKHAHLPDTTDIKKAMSLDEKLKSRDYLVRIKAIEQAEKTKDRRAVKPLIDILKNPEEYARNRAAEALGKIGDMEAFQPLISVLGDKNEVVRNKAFESLAMLASAGEMQDDALIKLLIDKYRGGTREERVNISNVIINSGDQAVSLLMEMLKNEYREGRYMRSLDVLDIIFAAKTGIHHSLYIFAVLAVFILVLLAVSLRMYVKKHGKNYNGMLVKAESALQKGKYGRAQKTFERIINSLE